MTAHRTAARQRHPGGEAPGRAGLIGYLTGFGLSVVLTAIPFLLVMTNLLGDNVLTALAITAFAVTQVLVHMVFFLHMNGRSEGGWTMLAMIFTIVLVVIAISGSLWVMYHLTTNMTPMSADDAKSL